MMQVNISNQFMETLHFSNNFRKVQRFSNLMTEGILDKDRFS